MINLLPTEQKKILTQERDSRIVSSIVFLLFIFLISFIFILFLNKEIVSIELDKQTESVMDQFNDEDISTISDFENTSKEYGDKIEKINVFNSNVINITELLRDISDILPEGTYIKNINYGKKINKGKQSINEISIYGFASKRDDLIILKENLENKDRFKNINFPSSNWVKPENISFTVTFEI
jgi:Tfp pilus assembly protein PilN